KPSSARCCCTSALDAAVRRNLRISHAELLLYRFSLYCPDSGHRRRPLPVLFAPLYLFESLLAAFGKSTTFLGLRALALWHHFDPARAFVALAISTNGGGGAWQFHASPRHGTDRLGSRLLLRV